MYSPKFFKREDVDTAVKKSDRLLNYPNLFIKVVYEDRPEVQAYLDWLTENITMSLANRVWLMPEGVNRAELIKNSEAVFDACEKYKFNFSSRSHLIFGFV